MEFAKIAVRGLLAAWVLVNFVGCGGGDKKNSDADNPPVKIDMGSDASPAPPADSPTETKAPAESKASPEATPPSEAAPSPETAPAESK